ncbi:nuclease-related domain-containing protein [Cytobacillus sp. FSL W7-1323]|uniref:nuclease-related domain-containing protein n=1 Tax=unclassified Cytobacillus TaxID=2675268 RepID=UPI0030F6F584
MILIAHYETSIPSPTIPFSSCTPCSKGIIVRPPSTPTSNEKGADGEIRWTTLLSELPDDIPILYDLNLEINQSIIQLDALCILQNKIVIFEIKNFSGNYTLVGDQWLSPSKKK